MQPNHPNGRWCVVSSLCSEDSLLRLNATIESTLQGPLAPNVELRVSMPRKLSAKELRVLAIGSWELPKSLGLLVRLQLQEKLFVDPSDMSRVALLSREGAETVLTNSYGERDFFGNFVPTLRKLLRTLGWFLRRPPKARRPVRRRGYRDAHSGFEDVTWLREWSKDFESSQLQLTIEDRRRTMEALFQSFWGWADPKCILTEGGDQHQRGSS